MNWYENNTDIDSMRCDNMKGDYRKVAARDQSVWPSDVIKW